MHAYMLLHVVLRDDGTATVVGSRQVGTGRHIRRKLWRTWQIPVSPRHSLLGILEEVCRQERLRDRA